MPGHPLDGLWHAVGAPKVVASVVIAVIFTVSPPIFPENSGTGLGRYRLVKQQPYSCSFFAKLFLGVGEGGGLRGVTRGGRCGAAGLPAASCMLCKSVGHWSLRLSTLL